MDMHFGALAARVPAADKHPRAHWGLTQRGARTDPLPLHGVQDETVRRLEAAVAEQEKRRPKAPLSSSATDQV